MVWNKTKEHVKNLNKFKVVYRGEIDSGYIPLVTYELYFCRALAFEYEGKGVLAHVTPPYSNLEYLIEKMFDEINARSSFIHKVNGLCVCGYNKFRDGFDFISIKRFLVQKGINLVGFYDDKLQYRKQVADDDDAKDVIFLPEKRELYVYKKKKIIHFKY
ncbi:hypothetical protein J4468_03185 [Candidatus Woesearchaeota archaeon]|nr:hypothetical protein [Candidatus Woesearchaeota archaeon]